MNITDYLVDYLKHNGSVSLPHVGLFSTRQNEAYFDTDSSTFFPRHQTVVLENKQGDNNGFVKFISDKECVSLHTAELIWKNYCDAFNAKLTSEGKCRLNELGTVISENGACHFESESIIEPDGTTGMLSPVTGLKDYTPETENDPFAAFEQPIQDGEIISSPLISDMSQPTTTNKPKPVEPEPVAEPEPIEEPKPVAEPEPVVEPEPVEVSETPAEPEKPAEPEPIAEPEPVNEPEASAEPEPIAEPEPVEEPEAPAEPEPIAEHETSAFGDDALNTLQQLDAITPSTPETDDDDEPKKGGFWKVLLTIILILAILAGCAFAIDHYLFNSKGMNWLKQKTSAISTAKSDNATEIDNLIPDVPADYDKDEARSNITFNTFSFDGITFSESEIAEQSKSIVDEFGSYLNNYLKKLKQTDNETQFIDRVESYANTRLAELLKTEDFVPQNLLNYKDYVREEMTPLLKDRLIRRKATIVKSELIDRNVLEKLLKEVNPAITPSEIEAAEDNDAKKNTTVKKDNKTKTQPIQSHIATESKQGFDIIAGFSVDKNNADRLCRQLKSKGCDAYIINRNGLYYVSMGSAATQTEAKARYNHIKEWYKGDVSIKQW